MRRLLSGVVLLAAALASPARGQDLAPVIEGAGDDPRVSVSQPETTSQASGGYVRSIQPYLGPFGDPLGIRPVLKEKGIEYSLTYIADVLGNPVGGVRQGAIIKLTVAVDSDSSHAQANDVLDRVAVSQS